jgi:hypothetical protein
MRPKVQDERLLADTLRQRETALLRRPSYWRPSPWLDRVRSLLSLVALSLA